MSRLVNFGILIVLGLIASALAFVVWLAESDPAQKRSEAISSLRALGEVEAVLRQDVLGARTGLVLHYDDLVETVARQRRIVAALRAHAVGLPSDEGREVLRTIDAFARASAVRADDIERFKSANAVLRNSVAYLPSAVNDVAHEARLAGRVALHDSARSLGVSILMFLSGDYAAGRAIEAARDRIRVSAASSPPSVRSELAILTRHVDIILEQKARVEALVERIVRGDVPLQELSRVVDAAFDLASTRAAKTRHVLYGVAATLVTLLLLALVWLRRTALAFDAADRQLRESERRMRTLMNHIPGIAYRGFGDAARTMSFVSARCPVVTGHEPQEFTAEGGGGLLRLVSIDDRDRVSAEISRAIEHNEPYEVEYRITTTKGEERWIWDQGLKVGQDDDGKPIVEGLFLDVTARKQAEKEKLDLERRLQRSHLDRLESLGTLAGGIGHEINNALVPVVGLTELMIETAGDDANRSKHLNTVHASAIRAQDLVAQIVAFARKAPTEEQSPIDLRTIVREAETALRATLPPGVALKVAMLDDPLLVRGDAAQLRQIIHNLARNGVDAIGEGSGNLEVELKSVELAGDDQFPHATLTPGVYAKLSVSDNGCGMSKETINRAFEPFFTTKPVGKGTGLGLSVVHGIVQQHAGAVQVSSEPGRGSRFDVYLPQHRADASADERAIEPLRLTA